MATLGSLIQPNEQSYFFALSGGPAPPAPGQPLQSPVAVIPDGTGNTTLSLVATGIAGASAVSVTGSAGIPGGPGNVIVGGFGTVYRMGVEDASGVLQIGLNSVAAPVIQYDSQNTHQLLLGDKSAASTASVQTNVPFVVRDYSTDPTVANGIAMDVNSSTVTSIKNACATGGTMNLGSSQATPTTLTIVDSGANTGVVRINGTSGGTDVQIFGGGVPTVSTNTANNGTLQLRSSAAGYAGGGGDNGIVLTDNPVSNTRPLATFRSQIVLPNSDAGSWSGIAGQLTTGITALTYPGQATGTIPGGQSVALPLPPSGAAYTGLWMYRILTNAITDTQAIQCGMTLTTYWDGALNAFAYGGSGNPYFGGSLGSVTSNGNVRIVPIVVGLYVTSYIFANFTGSQIAGMAVQLVQVTGAF